MENLKNKNLIDIGLSIKTLVYQTRVPIVRCVRAKKARQRDDAHLRQDMVGIAESPFSGYEVPPPLGGFDAETVQAMRDAYITIKRGGFTEEELGEKILHVVRLLRSDSPSSTEGDKAAKLETGGVSTKVPLVQKPVFRGDRFPKLPASSNADVKEALDERMGGIDMEEEYDEDINMIDEEEDDEDDEEEEDEEDEDEDEEEDDDEEDEDEDEDEEDEEDEDEE